MRNLRRMILSIPVLAAAIWSVQGPISYVPGVRDVFPFNIGVNGLKGAFIETYLSESREWLVSPKQKHEDGELFGQAVGAIAGRQNVVYAKPRQIYYKKARPELLRDISDEEFTKVVSSYDGPCDWSRLYNYVSQKKTELKSVPIKNASPAPNTK